MFRFGVTKLAKLYIYCNYITHEVDYSKLVQLQLQTILTEYAALKSEIRYRTGFQNHLVQLHFIFLGAILAAGLSNILTIKTSLLLIPIESSLFGLWYFDCGLRILEIGAYIRKCIEAHVHKILGKNETKPKIMIWESEFRKSFNNDSFAIEVGSLMLILLTFGGPTLFCIAYGCLYFHPQINNDSFIIILGVIIDLVLFGILFFFAIWFTYETTKSILETKNESK
jgi:hypothetical protein